MPHPKIADFRGLLDVLSDARVEHIVVGGVAAIMHGSPTTTKDLDIVHRRTEENVARLLAVLAGVDAFVRERLRPDASLLLRGRQLLFSTSRSRREPR